MLENQQECAAQVIATFDLVMRSIRSDAHKRTPRELSIQQFRTIMCVKNHEGANLSLVAEHLGVTISSTSKIVDGLVERGLINREVDQNDRRKIMLGVTESGESIVRSMKHGMMIALAEKLDRLSTSETQMVKLAMDILRSAFVQAKAREE